MLIIPIVINKKKKNPKQKNQTISANSEYAQLETAETDWSLISSWIFLPMFQY